MFENLNDLELVNRIGNLEWELERARDEKRERDRDKNHDLYEEYKEAQAKYSVPGMGFDC